jgi:hypothetical protein
MAPLDLRIVKVSIEVNGKLRTYSDVNITATGTKYANPLQNECEVVIDNLAKDVQNFILTESSPYNLNRRPKKLILEAGRQSYGVTKIYEGNIISSKVTQPPDIQLHLKCLTGNFLKGLLIGRNQLGFTSLLPIAQAAARDVDMRLNFQATDRQVANYSFSGPAIKQIDALNGLGGINVYVDDNTLVVKDAGVPLRGAVKLVDEQNGMVGIPEITEQGLKVKFLLDNKTVLGGLLRVKSNLYPVVNGDYLIYKLGFEITNRARPFYYTAECMRLYR